MRTGYAASIYSIAKTRNHLNMLKLTKRILQYTNIYLSTHKNADGDGLGSEVALYHALKKINKNVQLIANEEIPHRYSFLKKNLTFFTNENLKSIKPDPDSVFIIFDTHDPKLCENIYNYAQANNILLIFIDHHVPFKSINNNVEYYIDEEVSCTGEIVYNLIESLDIAIDPEIATALYASLIFDTQNFKHIKNEHTFILATKLIKLGANHKKIQHHIFDNWTIKKMQFLSDLVTHVEFKSSNRVALIRISKTDLSKFSLNNDDVSDFIDLFMQIQNLEIAIVLREEGDQYFKMSFRGRTQEVLSWAQSFGGGGHRYSSGAWVSDSEKNILNQIQNLVDSFDEQLL